MYWNVLPDVEGEVDDASVVFFSVDWLSAELFRASAVEEEHEDDV